MIHILEEKLLYSENRSISNEGLAHMWVFLGFLYLAEDRISKVELIQKQVSMLSSENSFIRAIFNVYLGQFYSKQGKSKEETVYLSPTPSLDFLESKQTSYADLKLMEMMFIIAGRWDIAGAISKQSAEIKTEPSWQSKLYEIVNNTIRNFKEGLQGSEAVLLKLISDISDLKIICGDASPLVAVLLGLLAAIYISQDRWEKAEDVLLQCIAISEEDHRLPASFLISQYMHIWKNYNHQNRNAEAEGIIMKAFTVMLRRGIYETDLHAQVYFSMGETFRKLKKFVEAEKVLLKAISILNSTAKDDNFYLSEAYNNLVKVYIDEKKWMEAESLLEMMNKTSEFDVLAYMNLAYAYQNQGKLVETEIIIIKAIYLLVERVLRLQDGGQARARGYCSRLKTTASQDRAASTKCLINNRRHPP